jgi:hypothetical protein
MDYIQIDRTNWMESILQEFPAFRSQWEQHLASWSLPISRPIALDIAEFADFAIATICLDVEQEIDKLATIIEIVLLQGDSIVEYAFRRMLLEQIAHRSTKQGFAVDRFVSKLQPLGYYQWQAMDRQWAIHPAGVSIDPHSSLDQY